MTVRRWRAAVVPALIVVLSSGCGMYGETGFMNRGAMKASTFVRETDDLCKDKFRDLKDDVLNLFREPPADDEAFEQGHLKDAHDDIEFLVEDLDLLRGPDDLQVLMDEYVALMADAERILDDAYEMHKDSERGIADIQVVLANLGALSTLLDDIEPQLEAAGFEYCGLPFDPDAE